jgi:hypothetical protein
MGIRDRLKKRVKNAGVQGSELKPRKPASSTTEPKDETIQSGSRPASAQAQKPDQAESKPTTEPVQIPADTTDGELEEALSPLDGLESEQEGPPEPKPGPNLSAIDGGLSEASHVDDSPPTDLLEDDTEDGGSGDEPPGEAPEEVRDEQADINPADAPPLDLLEDDPEEVSADEPDSTEEAETDTDSVVELNEDFWAADEADPETEGNAPPELEDEDEAQEDDSVDADPEQGESEDEEEVDESVDSSEAETVRPGAQPAQEQDEDLDLEQDSAESEHAEPETVDATEPEGFLEFAVDYVTDHPMEFGAMAGSGVIAVFAATVGLSLWPLALVPTMIIAGVLLITENTENNENRGETSD